jgi:hypothetical protein
MIINDKMMPVPPSKGIGVLCIFLGRFGVSIALIFLANFFTNGVNKTHKINADKNNIIYEEKLSIVMKCD